MSSIRYQGASWSTKVGKCMPGSVALSSFIRFFEPYHFTNMGCFNDRPARGTEDVPSLHREGRAIDIGANANVPWAKERMDHWCRELIRHHEVLGVQQIIWNRRSWRAGRDWKPYSGVSPHTDHAHIEVTWWGAENITTDLLRKVFFPPVATPVQEDDMPLNAEDKKWVQEQLGELLTKTRTTVLYRTAPLHKGDVNGGNEGNVTSPIEGRITNAVRAELADLEQSLSEVLESSSGSLATFTTSQLVAELARRVGGGA